LASPPRVLEVPAFNRRASISRLFSSGQLTSHHEPCWPSFSGQDQSMVQERGAAAVVLSPRRSSTTTALDSHNTRLCRHAGSHMRQRRHCACVGGTARSDAIRLDYSWQTAATSRAARPLALRSEPTHYQVSLVHSHLAPFLTGSAPLYSQGMAAARRVDEGIRPRFLIQARSTALSRHRPPTGMSPLPAYTLLRPSSSQLTYRSGGIKATTDILEKHGAALTDHPRAVAAGETVSGGMRILLVGAGAASAARCTRTCTAMRPRRTRPCSSRTRRMSCETCSAGRRTTSRTRDREPTTLDVSGT
jgi:hypothetical protein